MPVEETILKFAIFDQLQRAMAANPAGFAELYRDYLGDAWQALRTMRNSAALRQAEATRTKAHYLKSGSLILGAQRVARDAARMEEAAISGNLENFGELLFAAERDLRELQTELVKRLGPEVVPAGASAA